MKDKTGLAFTKNEFDLASHFRKNEILVSEFSKKADTLNILVWKGKILLDVQESNPRLYYLPNDHKLLKRAKKIAFLGLGEKRQSIFLYALKNWRKDQNKDNSLQFIDDNEDCHPDLPDMIRFIDLKKVFTALKGIEMNISGIAKSLFEWHSNNKFCSHCGGINKIIQSGWELICSKCEGKTFPRTDPVVIMLIEREDTILLGRSSFWPQGMYSCLAGFVEPGECIEDAVRRETYEEVGVKLISIQYITSQSWPFPHSLMLGFRATALSAKLKIDYHELEAARWFTRDEVELLQHYNNSELKLARKGTIANYLIQQWLKH